MSDWPIVNEEQFSESQGDETSQSDAKKVVPFAVRACDFCKKRKIRCEGTIPCLPCQRRGQVCTFTREQSRRGPKPKRVRRDPAPVTSVRSLASEEGSELVSLQPLSQDLSKLKIELEIQKRLESHWKQQYFDLLQQQQNTQLAVGTSNIPAYLRNIFVENNATGLALDSEPGSSMIGQFSSASWGLIRDPDVPFKLQTLFNDGSMCSTVPTYKVTLPIDEPVNALIWKVLMNNTPEKIADFLRHETTPLVMQFFQSTVIFAQGLRTLDDDQMHADVGNHLLLVINGTFNILFYQREVQYNVKYIKQITYELLNLSQFLKYTGSGAATKQLSPLLIQIIQQFEPVLDDPDLVSNAVTHLLNKSDTESELNYWMAKLNGLPTQNPMSKAFQDFSIVLSALRIVAPESQTPDMLRELLARIDAAQQLLTTAADSDPKNRETYKFYNIWSPMARAELFYRLNEMQEHEVALKETMHRYFALPSTMFRKALHGLASLLTAEGVKLVTASKLLQLADESFDPSGMPRDMSLIIQQSTSSIVEIHSSSDEVNSEVVVLSPHDSNESHENFDDFIFDPIEQITEVM